MAPLKLARNKTAHSDLVFSDNGGCHEFWKWRTFVAAGRPVADYYSVGVIHAPLGRRDNGRSSTEAGSKSDRSIERRPCASLGQEVWKIQRRNCSCGCKSRRKCRNCSERVAWNARRLGHRCIECQSRNGKGRQMPILLWLMGVPIMLIVVLMLFGIA